MRRGGSKTFFDYANFVRRWGQMLQCWHLTQELCPSDIGFSETTIAVLLEINDVRINIQKAIDRLNETVSCCSTCSNSCCMGSYNHFRSTDFYLRKFSSSSLPDYERIGPSLWLPRLKYYAGFSKKPGDTAPSQLSINRSGCSFLTSTGCALDVSDRPIMCVAFTCGRFREAMTGETKKEYAKSLKHLYEDVCIPALDCLKREVGVSRYHGRLSLLLMPC